MAEDAPRDPAVLEELTACERDLERWLAEPVGALHEPAPLGAPDSPAARLLLEALLHHAPADLGVLIAVHVTEGLPAGEVTRGDVWHATSSPGNLTTATLTGAEVRQMLARGWSEGFRSHTSRVSRGRPFGALQVIGVELDGGVVRVGGEPLDGRPHLPGHRLGPGVLGLRRPARRPARGSRHPGPRDPPRAAGVLPPLPPHLRSRCPSHRWLRSPRHRLRASSGTPRAGRRDGSPSAR